RDMTALDDLPPSLRTAGDSWAITESVGATALGVAAARAVVTAGASPLIRDEFAFILVSPAGPACTRLADVESAWLDDEADRRRVQRTDCNEQAVRRQFYD